MNQGKEPLIPLRMFGSRTANLGLSTQAIQWLTMQGSSASVNVVQSGFPDSDQGEISGVSRSISNLGSSLGTALAGSVLVAASHPGGRPFAFALSTMLVIALIGPVLAILLPKPPAAAVGAALSAR